VATSLVYVFGIWIPNIYFLISWRSYGRTYSRIDGGRIDGHGQIESQIPFYYMSNMYKNMYFSCFKKKLSHKSNELSLLAVMHIVALK